MTNNNNQVNITFKAFTTEFNKSVAGINAESARLRQEFSLQEAQIANTATATEKISLRIQSLNAQYEISQRRTAETNTYLLRAQQLYGDNSVEAAKFTRELVQAQIAEQRLANQIQTSTQSLERQERSIQDLNRLFQVTGATVQDFANELGQDLVQAIQNGTASVRQLDSAFGRVGNAAVGAGVNLNELRSTLSQLNNGAPVSQVQASVQQLGQSLQQAQNSASGLGSELGRVTTALAGAAAGALGVQQALEQSAQNNQIDLVFNVDDQGTEVVRRAVDTVTAFGVDGQEALEGVRRQFALNTDQTDESNASLARNAAAISQLYEGIDFTELIQEAREIGTAIGVTTEQALELTDRLLNVGFPPEQLDIIAEYGSQLQRAGFEAGEIEGVFIAASQSGTFNIDNLLDGLKEGRIRASELGLGLSEGFQDALRTIVDGSNEITEEEVARIETRFQREEEALSDSLDAQYRQRESALASEEEALSKSLDTQLQAYQRNTTLQERATRRAQTEEIRAFEQSSNARLDLIDKEYRERLRLTNEEEYNRLRAIDAQVSGIEALIDADARNVQQQEENTRRAELTRAVELARTNRNREIATQALADFEGQVNARNLLESRRNQIEALGEERDNVREVFDAREASITQAFEAQREQARESIGIERDAIRDRQSLQLEALRDTNQATIEGIRETNQADITAFRATNAEKLRLLRDTQSEQIERFSEQNAVRLDTIVNPPDSAQFRRVVSDIENLGRSVANATGGAEAFEEINEFLKGIDDATLRNAVGVELFGVQYEDQAESLTYVLDNFRTAQDQAAKSTRDLSQVTDQYSQSSAVEYRQAIQDLQTGLTPILSVIGGIVGAISSFVSTFPGFSAIVATVATLAGLISGALFLFQPLIPLFTSIGTAILGFLPSLTTIITFLTTVGRVLIPALVTGLSSVAVPISLVIALAAILISEWDKVSAFFNRFVSYISVQFQAVRESLTGPFLNARDTIVNVVDEIQNKFTFLFTTFGRGIRNLAEGFGNFFRAPINSAIAGVNKLIDAINEISIEIPDFVPVIGGRQFGFDIPRAQYFADGGVLNRATVFGNNGGRPLVGGEAGPEAIIPLRADVLAGIGRGIVEASGINNSTVVNFEGIFNGANISIRSDDDIKSIARELYSFQERNRRGR